MEIHPETAAGLSLARGDWAWVTCPRIPGERAAFKVKHTPGLQPEVVHVPHGWWFPERPGPEHGCFESNINVVISAEPPREEVCGSVPTRGTLCRIEKMEI
ncbi:MAG: molybdopterin dinucleotide binding domain-containing protein [Desulfobacteraceae bacterium]